MINSQKDSKLVLSLILKHKGSQKTATIDKTVFSALSKNLTQAVLSSMVSKDRQVKADSVEISTKWVELSENERMLVIDELSNWKDRK
jgi:hypothetical protein